MIVFAVLVVHLIAIHQLSSKKIKTNISLTQIKYLESFEFHPNSDEQKTSPEEVITSERAPTKHATPISTQNKPSTHAHRKAITSKSGHTLNPGAQTSDLLSTHAGIIHQPPPEYPRQSRRRGEQGKVIVLVEINAQGIPTQSKIHTSSGYPRLDQAALETVLKWRFSPGNQTTVSQKMWVNIPINFVLE